LIIRLTEAISLSVATGQVLCGSDFLHNTIFKKIPFFREKIENIFYTDVGRREEDMNEKSQMRLKKSWVPELLNKSLLPRVTHTFKPTSETLAVFTYKYCVVTGNTPSPPPF
jgi:hypothetical protein